MNSSVLLIYPGGLNSLFPEVPLPHLYLASGLQKNGYDVQIFDARLTDINTIEDKDYLFVGISSMTGEMIKNALEAARKIRQINPKIPIIWGGIHASLLPDETLESEFVDIVVRGEGELTIQDLAHTLETGGDLSDVLGISYKEAGNILHTKDRKTMDLDELDIRLPYHLIDLDKYSLEYFPVVTSRGCPWRCAFCYIVSFSSRAYRKKSAERVLDEIEYIVNELGYRKITFTYDDEYFIDIKRVRAITIGIIERKLDIEWTAFCRFDSFNRVTDEDLKLIEASGCTLISLGGESGSERLLANVIKKDITLEMMVEGTRRMAQTGITQVVSMISGVPTETIEDQRETFDFMDSLYKANPNVVFNGVFLYTPYPGTELYDRATKDFGFKPPQSLEEWSEFGIYRNVGTTWHSKKYIEQCKTLSILTRFPFYRNSFSLKDVNSVLAGQRISKFPFNWMFYIYTKSAIFRWKKRFFRFPMEYIVLEKYLMKIRGYV